MQVKRQIGVSALDLHWIRLLEFVQETTNRQPVQVQTKADHNKSGRYNLKQNAPGNSVGAQAFYEHAGET